MDYFAHVYWWNAGSLQKEDFLLKENKSVMELKKKQLPLPKEKSWEENLWAVDEQAEERFQRERAEWKKWVKSGCDQITQHSGAWVLLRAAGLQDSSGGESNVLMDLKIGWIRASMEIAGELLER